MTGKRDRWQWYREHPFQAALLAAVSIGIWIVIVLANVPLGLG